MSHSTYSREAMLALREALARKYPLPEEARHFVVDVKLDPIRIAFHNRADLTWFSILSEAENRGPKWVRAVVDHALQRWPDDEVLLSVRDGSAVRYAEGPDIKAIAWHGGDGSLAEKILGAQSTLVPVSFLELGMLRARAVARIRAADGSLGTGFLLADDLLVTNHHVLGEGRVAAGATAHFNYQKTVEGRDAEMELGLDPEGFFRTSSCEDDCTIVKVTGNPTARWGMLAALAGGHSRERQGEHHPAPGATRSSSPSFTTW
ncbi:MAG: effector-associated domain EAD1-containing protein [Polyangiaceae bacterium]